jgi:hypothetical protein
MAEPRHRSYRQINCAFEYLRKCRHFRRLAARSPVSGEEIQASCAEGRDFRRESLLDDFLNIRNLGAGAFRDRLRFRRDRFESAISVNSPADDVRRTRSAPPELPRWPIASARRTVSTVTTALTIFGWRVETIGKVGPLTSALIVALAASSTWSQGNPVGAASPQAPIGHRQPSVKDLPPDVARDEQSDGGSRGEQQPDSVSKTRGLAQAVRRVPMTAPTEV